MDPQLKSQSSSGISHGCTCYFYFPRHLGLPNWPFRPLAHIFLGNYKVFQSYVGKGGYTGGNPTLDSPKTFPAWGITFSTDASPWPLKADKKYVLLNNWQKVAFFRFGAQKKKIPYPSFPLTEYSCKPLRGQKSLPHSHWPIWPFILPSCCSLPTYVCNTW